MCDNYEQKLLQEIMRRNYQLVYIITQKYGNYLKKVIIMLKSYLKQDYVAPTPKQHELDLTIKFLLLRLLQF